MNFVVLLRLSFCFGIGHAAIINKPSPSPTPAPTHFPNSCSILDSLAISLPTVNATNVTLTDLICDDFFLEELPSNYVSPTSLSFSLQDLHAGCTGSYIANTASEPSQIAFSLTTTLAGTLQFGSANDLPASSTFVGCSTATTVTSQIQNPLIPRLVSKAVDAFFCTKFANLINVNFSNFLEFTVDPKLQSIIDSQPSVIPVFDFPTVNLMDGIFGKLSKILGGGVGTGKLLTCALENFPIAHEADEPWLNNIIDLVTDQTGVITIDINSTIPVNNGSITFQTLSLAGLDTFSEITLLEPVSNVSLVVAFALDYVDVILNSTINSLACDNYTENHQIKIRVSNVKVELDLAIAVNSKTLESLYLDQLSSCLLDAIEYLSISSFIFDLDVNEMALIDVSGPAGATVRADIITLIDNVFLLATQGFPTMVTEVFAGLMQGPIRQAINGIIALKMFKAKVTSPCPPHVTPTSTDYLPWSDSKVVSIVNRVVEGGAGLNKIMNCITNQTGSLVIETNNWEISLQGLNSFHNLSLLVPGQASDPYNLFNNIGLGEFEVVLTATSNTSSPFSESLMLDGPLPHEWQLSEEGEEDTLEGILPMGTSILLSLSDFNLYLNLFLKLDMNALGNLQVSQLGTQGCVGSSVAGAAIDALSLGLGAAQIVINDGQRTRNITNAVSKILDFFTNPSKIASRNAQISNKVVEAPIVCENGGVFPSSGSSSSKEDAWKWGIPVLVVASVGCLISFLWAYKYWGKNGRTMCADVSAKSDDDRSFWVRYGFDEALFAQTRLPLLLRIAMPILIVGTMGMFLNSNITPDAVSVMATIDIGPKVIAPDSIFDFGLQSTVQDMWDAGVYPLAILIAFFSGAWPYVKLAAMFVCWMAPTKVITIKRREQIMIWMDMLGKWSLIDFFVMTMFMCAFYFELALAPQLVVYVNVVPKWGFYGFLLATMISLGLGHIILGCHRLIVEKKVPVLPLESTSRESLSNHIFTVDKKFIPDMAHDADGGKIKLRMTTAGKVFVITFITLAAVILFCGTAIKTFEFSFKGLTGLLLQQAANVDYSFNSVGDFIPKASGTPDDFGVRWMQVSYYAYGVAMPAGLYIMLLVVWFFPLKLSNQKQLFVLVEVLNAWSGLDVFCVAIAAALLEIQQFAAFIVGDACDGINAILAKYLDPVLEGDDKCFDVVASLLPISWLIFLAAAMTLIVALPSLSLFDVALKDRQAQAESMHTELYGVSDSMVMSEGKVTSSNAPRSVRINSTQLVTPLLLNDDETFRVNSVEGFSSPPPNSADGDGSSSPSGDDDAAKALGCSGRLLAWTLHAVLKCQLVEILPQQAAAAVLVSSPAVTRGSESGNLKL